MHTNRRTWLKRIALLSAGIYLPKWEAGAAPLPGSHATSSDTIRLSSNENPYGPSPAARRAMADSINTSNRYQWKQISELMKAIASRNGLTDENVLVGAGSTQILDALVQFAALQKGSFVLAEPTFSHWKGAAESAGLQKIAVPLTPDKHHDLCLQSEQSNRYNL